MIDVAQTILDITAIGISVYTITRLQLCILKAEMLTLTAVNHDRALTHLASEIKRVEELIPKEVFASGIEPGVYLPKEGKNADDAVDYVKSMDLNDWKEFVGKTKVNG